MPKPLSHLRIVDLSCVLAGPFSTQLLADLGAEVQKLEPPGGDPSRGWGPPFEEGPSGESAYFRSANRGKKTRTIDLHTDAGRADLFELLKDADVLVENFRADSADRLGLGWKRLHAKFPKLIVASIRGFASDVTASRRAGYDFIIQAESGWMAITGEPGGRPMKVGVPLVDVLAGLYCANGIQAALLHRERTGEAIHIEVPLMEAALAGMVNVAAGSLMTGTAPHRWGNAHPQIVPYQSFRCADGEVAIGVGSDRQFEVLAMWLGLDLEARPEWKRNPGRVQDREELVALIEARTSAGTADEVLAFCEANAIPASRVRSVDDVLFRKGGELHNLLQPLFEEESNAMIPTLAAPLLLNGERACASLPPPRRP
ncbi:CaiB/BaiF CoA-transferase family protein [Geothrix sp. 21YS21S-4]|uniref:CaiB/BaiF CoA transferase family protein n=1 Tax=Geothrix sp. 21YS21S-4 TaxID=3068889 RepID=UPI0027BA0E1F|nr:CoA transferase [Geothrix sp. 21YS21S-4]